MPSWAESCWLPSSALAAGRSGKTWLHLATSSGFLREGLTPTRPGQPPRASQLDGTGDTPIDADALPGHVSCSGGQEEHNRLGDLLNCPGPAHRDPGDGGLGNRVTVDEAGQYVVHADAVGGVRVGVQLGEAPQRSPKGA